MKRSPLSRFAWLVLAYNLLVILWGAFVRATGSGAGCGRHWPLCNGEILPRPESLETLVELSHRLTSGLALIAVVALTVWVFRRLAPGHPARRGAVWSLILMLTEAAVGAGLVLFELVADNASMARAMFMGTHLLNTFLLLAALVLTAYWIDGGKPFSWRRTDAGALRLAVGFVGLMVVGASGAVSALGDTLFPSMTLEEALAKDFSVTSHLLIRLRVFHPLLAVAAGLWVVFTVRSAGRLSSRAPVVLGWTPHGLANLVTFTVLGQLALGALSVALLAPIWIQLTHLLLADLIWISFVLYAAWRLRVEAPSAATARQGQAARGSTLAGRAQGTATDP